MKAETIISIIIGMLFLAACSNDDGPDNIEPQLFVDAASGITRTEATLTGHIVLKGNTPMPELRFIYGTTEDMGMRTETITADNGDVFFTLSNLTSNTTYNYLLQAENGRTTVRSAIRSFTTRPNKKPTVGSITKLSQGPISIIISFPIEDNGGETITEAGCYLTEADSSEPVKLTATTPADTDKTVEMRIGNLKQDSEYKLIAFVANSIGESVSDTLKIKTSNAITLSAAGSLSYLIGEDWAGFKTVSIAGPLNGNDFRLIRKMAGRNPDGTAGTGQLVEINLADASIVESGESYDGSHFTKNNIIGQGLFANCSKVKSLVLPDKATEIEKDAFLNCTALTSITIPASATTLNPSAGCTALESIDVSDANDSFKSIDGVLFNADATNLEWFPLAKKGDYTLPPTLKSIGEHAFKGCLLTSITLPKGLNKLGISAFYGSKLKTVLLPDDLDVISTSAFQNCTALQTVYIGKNTKMISDYAFDGCPIKDIYIDAIDPPICNPYSFNDTNDKFPECTLHVPAGCIPKYRAHETWSKAKKIVEQ